ncbi:J domain-containing protein [Borrelia miyamotoi]|uniref:J domain-containing protein n=1 Tax=Borrelia miyamotoi TaxID=47466 RepID=A0AAQ2WVJ3_9SPIR|nr:J domain-containing protein [Borrelia miyamotoi]AOW95808.1 molecular chaperone DnaJ [Borrelia miyamotoi]QTL83696.1 J domain-containing protein [Borrelia miyamotoi]WAZ85001.1 J domain-containing protein [Borrelia miyamotoi]WAZ90784.1 J domain-containing protein [Borrelia miyamotoi]WAZ92066.1 J domain-containing protein [Borrelia miyamotoi]
MSNLFQILFLLLPFIVLFSPFILIMFLIFFVFFMISIILGGFRIYPRRDYSYSKSREFEFYKLSFLLIAKLISILGSMTGEQLSYINFLINSLNLSERYKTELYNIFHFSITQNRNADKILYTLKLGYSQYKDLFVWLVAALKEINNLSRYGNYEGDKFIRYVSSFLELDFENHDTYKNVNIKIVNPYKVLGLKYDASNDDIKKAYKKWVMKCHPDRFANEPVKQREANEKFIKIQEAYAKICKERNLK